MTARIGRAACLLAALCLLLVAAPRVASAAPLSLVSVGSFEEPTYVTAAPGDPSRVYVVERRGVIKVLRGGQATTFADLSALIRVGDTGNLEGERGLLSIAFAPDFATSRRFYAYFTGKPPLVSGEGDIVIARFVATSPDSAPPTAELLVSAPHDNRDNHNGGQLQFGPDGYLYAGTGDGGAGDDPAGNGQNLDSDTPDEIGGVDHHPLLGKLLRLDVSRPTRYAIPPGNAFGGPTKAPEIFAYGLRNPYRFSFDNATGDLLIGDVGQGRREEIDLLPAGSPAGANFGWQALEGSFVNRPLAGVTLPVLEYGHADSGGGKFGNIAGCSVTGGYVVRDPQLPELAGQYVYGDYCVSQLRAARLTAGGSVEDRELLLPELPGGLISFGEDACGRLHVATQDGTVQRLVSGGGDCLVARPRFPSAPGAPPSAPGGPAGAANPGNAATPGSPARRPVLTVRGTSAQRAIATGRLRLTLSCDVVCDVRAGGLFLIGRQKPGTRPKLVLQQRRSRLDGKARVRIDLRSSSRTRRIARRALRRGRPVTARVVLRVAAPGGSTRTRVVRVRILRAR